MGTAASPAQFRDHLRRRSWLRGYRRIWGAEHSHPATRCHGDGGTEVDQLLCPARMFAESSGAPHRQASRPQRDVWQSGRNSTEGFSRKCGPGIATRGTDDCRAIEVCGLSDRYGGQVASWPAPTVSADASGLRLVVRSSVLARHADDRAARQRMANRRVLFPEARGTGTCH